MSHLRLTTSTTSAAADEHGPAGDDRPDPGAAKFASFTPMNDQPGLADRKASFVIGASGLLLSTALFFVMPLRQFVVRPGLAPAAVLALASGLAVVIVVGIRAAYRCCMLPVPPRPGNLLFFQNVASGAPSDYAAALEGATPRDALRAVLDYNHTMAGLAVAKYRLVARAMLCLRVAIPLWVALLIVISLTGK
jgi:hypothetical protein